MIHKFFNNTKYYFGEDCLKNNLSNEIKSLKGKKILLMYGGGSIKKNGIYQTIVSEIKKAKVSFVEHSGVKPNPTNDDATKAINFGRKNKVNLIIAVGGGSVIDESKIVSIAIPNTHIKDAWQLVKNMKLAKKTSLPIISIITIAATGSENNYGSVITNNKTHDKWGVITPVRPCVCFEDPSFTKTVSKWQTACGIFDILSHSLESYYDLKQEFYWTKQYLIANMKTLLHYAKIVMKNPNNIEARANILWTSSWALNGLNEFATGGGDWKVHSLEHALSAKYDVSHGAGLALITPTYIEYMAGKYETFRILTLELGDALFGVKSEKKFVKKLKDFIKSIGLPEKYTDFEQIKQITKEDLNDLVKTLDRSLPNQHQLAEIIYNKIPK